MIEPRVDDRDRSNRQAVWSAGAVADLDAICVAAGCATVRDEALARHTSMGVGGPTPLMIWPRRPEAVATALAWCATRGLGWRVLGGGTNVLVSDAGVLEPVLNLGALNEGATVNPPTAVFPAGTPTARALKATIRKGLQGLVWATGLPGTLGGAAAGNAGCWGGRMADVVARIDVVDGSGVWQTLSAAELHWSYRSHPLPEAMRDTAVIVAVAVSLQPHNPARLQERSDELHAAKRERQPLGARNAGCIFRNPEPDSAAGRLIDDAGCKGLRVGDAQISELHGNFLINHGNATTTDIDKLIAAVKDTVQERFGMALEEEIHRW
jgi:UDP-N-acetylmuramate dehydrogenase